MRSFGYGGSAEGPAASVQGMRSPQGEHNPVRECTGPPARAQSLVFPSPPCCNVRSTFSADYAS